MDEKKAKELTDSIFDKLNDQERLYLAWIHNQKNKEIKRLNNNWNKLKKWIEEYRNETGLSEYETGISDALYDTLKKMKALQGSDKNEPNE